jgi:predicted transcriptional regulator
MALIALDTILSAVDYRTHTWSHDIESNKAGRILRYLIIRLYDEGRGKLIPARLELAQTTIAQKLGVSRQWVGVMVGRLRREGWIDYGSKKRPDGMNSSTVWKIGRQLTRLVITLIKSSIKASRQKKNPIHQPAKSNWHFSPTEVEKELSLIREKEKQPPKPETMAKIPLLEKWMGRGQGGEKEKLASN